VKRVLTDRDIVILDSANYIKGWRYQLYCEAKAVRTPSVVLQVGCSREWAKDVNEARLRRLANALKLENGTGAEAGESKNIEDQTQAGGANDGSRDEAQKEEEKEEAYQPASWENLVFRYEEPNAMNRWDSPLFTLVPSDDTNQTHSTFSALWEAIAGETRRVIKPNQATVQRSRDTGGDYLYTLDRETQEIVRLILEQQGESDSGMHVKVPSGGGDGRKEGEGELVVVLPMKKVGLPQLQRMRRAFMGMNRGGIGLEGVGNLAVERIRTGFVGYLNDAFEKDE
jgi:protein KTI12